jgi:hypothetical protein
MNEHIGPRHKTETTLVCDGCRFYLEWYEGGPRFSCLHPAVGEQQIDRHNLQTFCPVTNPRPPFVLNERIQIIRDEIKATKDLIASITDGIAQYDACPVSSVRPEEIEGRRQALVWRQEDLAKLLYAKGFLVEARAKG